MTSAFCINCTLERFHFSLQLLAIKMLRLLLDMDPCCYSLPRKIFQASTATPKAPLADAQQRLEVNEATSGAAPIRRLKAIQPLMSLVEDRAIADVGTAQSAVPPKAQGATTSLTSRTGIAKDESYCQGHSEEVCEEGFWKDLEFEVSVILGSEEAGKLFIKHLQERLLNASDDMTA